MPLGLQRCGIRTLLSRSFSNYTKQTWSAKVDASQVLAAYPIFNLNDESGRHLGPRQGDEAILTLSGGVDSSVAAYLAVRKGGLQPYKTIFMRNWNSLEEGVDFEPGSGGAQGCQWQRDWESVSAMGRWLGVEPVLMDLSAPYWNSVFSPALDDWSRGWTPNPDVLCNREIKFGELIRRLDQAEDSNESLSFGRRKMKRWLVTGHYARLEYYSTASASSVQGRLYRAKDRTKDQSYFLSAVSSEHLGRTHFPLSNLTKVEVRSLARTLGMPTAESVESMGLCFVGERKGGAVKKDRAMSASSVKTETAVGSGGFAGFLGDYIESQSGDIITLEGKVVASHKGLHTVTIGQGAKIAGAKEKYYVAAKYPTTNKVLIVPGSNHAWLQCHTLQVSSFTFIAEKDKEGEVLESNDILAQIRHRQDAVPCKARKVGDKVEVHFDPAILSVAEGQVCALYKGLKCLGSGVITSVETEATRHVQ